MYQNSEPEAFCIHAGPENLQGADNDDDVNSDRIGSVAEEGDTEPSKKESREQFWESINAALHEASEKRHSMLPPSLPPSQISLRRGFDLQYRFGWADKPALQAPELVQHASQGHMVGF